MNTQQYTYLGLNNKGFDVLYDNDNNRTMWVDPKVLDTMKDEISFKEIQTIGFNV